MQRVTHKMMVDSLQANLSDNFGRMAKVQGEIASGKRLRRPSDDPPAVNQALSVRSSLQLNDQYLRTIELSKVWLDQSESSMSSITNILSRAKELAVQGANDTFTLSDRQQIAAEVDQLLQAAVAAANTSGTSGYIFSGTRITTEPITVAGSVVTYNGDTNLMAREIGPGQFLSVNITGDRLVPILETLIDLRDDLLSGVATDISADIDTVSQANEDLLAIRAEVGSKVNRFDFAAERLLDVQLGLTALLSETEDVDMIDAITRFQLEQTVYKAALAVGGSTIQLSLLDFLK
ncbi:MAG: flagellar hook-associated protein FlgL [Chloroflexi bacterium]|nr:flagellar hook-associated protein FlgL [Chloroflexota bacterium]